MSDAPTREVPIAVDVIAGRRAYHVVCHDCILEAVHADLRAAAGEERAHLADHPDHNVETCEVSGE
jgi:hypothetical protein